MAMLNKFRRPEEYKPGNTDNPMTPDGVKTADSDRKVTANFVDDHVCIGIQALWKIKQADKTVRHLKYDW